MIKYELYTEHKHNAEYGRYEAYGIRASSSGRTVRLIGDISTDKEKVSTLVLLFNRERLALCHLDEAVEDFLYDLEV